MVVGEYKKCLNVILKKGEYYVEVEVFRIDKIKLYTLKLEQEELVVYNEYTNKMILTETKFYY